MINSVTINYSGDYDKQLDLMVRNFFATIQVDISYHNIDTDQPESIPSSLVSQTICLMLTSEKMVVNYDGTYSLETYGRNSNKIQAIKFLRAITNCGLREAKDLVEIFCIAPTKAEELTFMRKVKEHLDPLSPAAVRNAIIECNNMIKLIKG